MGLAIVGVAGLFSLERAASGEPDSAGVLRIGLAATIAFDVFMVILVARLTSSKSPKELMRAIALRSPDLANIWVPALAVLAMYGFVAGYAGLARSLGPDWIVPRSTIPDEITADPWTLLLAGLLTCVFAPVAEEVFYRGLLTRGLLRWGAYPALVVPAVTFSAIHLDPGSFVPFVVVGLVIGWLYWRRGSLTDAIVFHLLFNWTSFVLLVATS
ncbi:MAG: CPBP family intramembrane metalloprotease [Dehalococcoidia bacterium]|nr:CPBP family intramembrane metalloprotease [Dehalococcoidia bacterium]